MSKYMYLLRKVLLFVLLLGFKSCDWMNYFINISASLERYIESPNESPGYIKYLLIFYMIQINAQNYMIFLIQTVTTLTHFQ